MKKSVAQILHIAVHIGALLPLVWLFWAVPAGKLGGDPVDELIHFLGLGALRLLLLTLMISPLIQALHFNLLVRLRRPLGLWSFTWATLHFFSWLAFDLTFTWSLIGEELVKRTYILIGFTVWLLLAALAVTSIPKILRAMGRKWKHLHRFIYACAVLACIHFWWSLKSGWIEPAIYLFVAIALISFRRKTLLRVYFNNRQTVS